MFCGSDHGRFCACEVCRTVSKGYVIPARGKPRNIRVNRRTKEKSEVLAKPTNPFQNRSDDVAFNDNAFADQFPTLHEYLTQVRWQDGSARMTSTITMFCDGGALKLFLNDRHFDRSVCINCGTFAEALDTLEAQLANDSAQWKAKKGLPQTKGYTPF